MSPDRVNTEGGTYVGGELRAGTFIGRDQIVVINDFTDADLSEVLGRLRTILAAGTADLRADAQGKHLTIDAPGAPRVVLSADAAERLSQVAAQEAGETAYLTALQVHPRYGRWATQFVPLAGTLTTLERPPGWSEVPPEFTLLEVEGEGAQRRIRRLPLEDITAPLDDYEALVILGEPGSGKTTTLYKTALTAARDRLAAGEGRIPLFAALADYRGYASPHDFVVARWQQLVGDGSLMSHLRQGELLVLCDALNEMPFTDDRDYRARVDAWRRWVRRWPGNRFLFTCRSHDYGEPLGFHQVEIRRLDDERVRDFLTRYVPDLAAAAWARLQVSPLLALVRNPYYLKMLAYLLEQGGAWPERRATLFRGFVRVLLDRERRRGHPDWPGDRAVEDALTALAEALQPMGEGTRLPRSEVCRRLADRIATQDDAAAAPETVVRLGLAATLLDSERVPEGEEHLRFYHHQLQEYFAARALARRFEAGEELGARWRRPWSKRRMPDPGPLGDNEPLPPPPTTGWEEPTALAAGLVADPAAFLAGVRQVNPVLAARCVVEGGLRAMDSEATDAVRDDLLRDIGDPGIHLRARIAAGEALGRVGDPRFRAVTVAGARVIPPPLVEIPGGLFKMGSTRLAVRALKWSGFTAAQDEMPRHGVTLPAFYIGRYPVTNAEYACFIDAGGYDDERHWPTEAARAWLRGELGESGAARRYLELWFALQDDTASVLAQLKRAGVTPQQLEAVEMLAGMREDEVRALVQEEVTERSREEPAQWDDERFNNPAQPVVGVTWYEALAYTRWLQARLSAGEVRLRVWDGEEARDVAPGSGGVRVRLPSEAEWARAARGARGRRYAWGFRWDADRANTWEGHGLRTTPVGVYPRGRTPAGLFDMSGNVWEWTRSLYGPYPYDAEAREDLEDDGYRVLRGGAWTSIEGSRGVRPATGSGPTTSAIMWGFAWWCPWPVLIPDCWLLDFCLQIPGGRVWERSRPKAIGVNPKGSAVTTHPRPAHQYPPRKAPNP